MSLVGAVDALTPGELARHPESLSLQAYFDGWNQAIGRSPTTFPRFLNRREEREWRLGWADGKKATPPPAPEPSEDERADEEPVEPPALTPVLQVRQQEAESPTPYPPVDGSQPCAQTDPEAWFPEGQGASPRAAKRMCDSCRFRDACREYAVAHPDLIGVWGGTTSRERQVLRRERAGVAA